MQALYTRIRTPPICFYMQPQCDQPPSIFFPSMLTLLHSVIVNNTVTAAGAVLVLNGSTVSSSDRSVLSGNGNVSTGALPEVWLLR